MKNIAKMLLRDSNPQLAVNKEHATQVCELLANHCDFIKTELGVVNFKTGIMYCPTFHGLSIEKAKNCHEPGRVTVSSVNDLNKILTAYGIPSEIV